MRKVKILGAAFFAVLAFGVVSAAAANASEWLEGGKAITSPLSAKTTGTWTLIGKNFFGLVETEVKCTGELIGTVGAGAADNVTEVADLKGHKGGNGTKLECTVGTKNGGCVAGETATVEPEHMPWPSTLIKGTTTPKDEFKGSPGGAGGEPGFTVKCNGHTNTCEGKVVSDELVNLSHGTVEGKVLESKSEKCSESGSEAIVNAEGTTGLLSGTLSVAN